MKRNSKIFTDEITRVVDKICSSSFTQTFERIVREQPNYFSHEQHTLVVYYPNEVTWHQGEQRQDFIERIRRTHLKWFNRWLNDFSHRQPPYIVWTIVMDELITHIINLFFRIDLGDHITSDHTRQQFHQIANTIQNILVSIKDDNANKIDPAAIPLVQTCLLIFFYFTWDHELVMYLKSLQLIQLINDIIRIADNDEEIYLQAYRILAAIMTEKDIQQIKNASTIVMIFINFIKDALDGGIPYEARLHNSLRSLKVLVQHDDICEELIKQQGHRLFLRCALEDQFNPLKAKLPALEMLLALSFNNDFILILQKNVEFLNQLQTLISSVHEDLRQIAAALLWKIKQVSNSSTYSISQASSKAYDIMISCASSDQLLAQRIVEALNNDQYHVWIGSQLEYGALFDTIADVIENSEQILVCMSDDYKQSPFCKLQVSHAIAWQCHIIPLIMTSNYRADGWLEQLTNSLASSEIIDFSQKDFDKVYQQLKTQLDAPNKHHKIIPNNHHRHSIFKPILNENTPIESPATTEYPHCIDQWTKEQVKSFLFDKQLDALLPVVEGMNGQLIHQTYAMCLNNQQGMYLSFKEDINRSGRGTLTLKDYLTFLKEIKIYVPFTTTNQLNSVSTTVCSLS